MRFFQSEIIQYAQPNQSKAENDLDYRSRYGRNARAQSTYRKQQFGCSQTSITVKSEFEAATTNRTNNSLFDSAA